MKIYEHSSYDEYKRKNIELNLEKISRSCLTNKLDDIINYINRIKLKINRGICHGVRRGNEVSYFSEKLKCNNIIGTEISHTATQFKNILEWDYHNIKDEWLNSFDFIYSNALDHSHSPEYCIAQWIQCLSETGLIFVEWCHKSGHTVYGGNAADCFGATVEEISVIFQNMNCLKEFVKAKSGYDFFVLHKTPIQIEKFKNKFSS